MGAVILKWQQKQDCHEYNYFTKSTAKHIARLFILIITDKHTHTHIYIYILLMHVTTYIGLLKLTRFFLILGQGYVISYLGLMVDVITIHALL